MTIAPPAARRRRLIPWAAAVIVLALIGAGAWFVSDELETSRHQAEWLSRYVHDARGELRPEPSRAIRYPGSGPFDERLGYHELPQRIALLRRQGFDVSEQVRWSPRMIEIADAGLFVPYAEKTRAGLELRDCGASDLYAAAFPQAQFERFEDLPPLLVASLLGIEDRHLLDPPPTRNPAIAWDRFGKAVADQALRRLHEEHSAGGASTLATQIEKFRHSPDGRTDSGRDKLLQMASASLRAYIDGPDTTARRHRIVLDYLNNVPLSAQSGFGEVIGIGDGLFAWYGRNFADVRPLLANPLATPAGALAFKQALSLTVAQRRPSYYLSEAGAQPLRALTDGYLRSLAAAGVIPPALRDAALPLALSPLRQAPAPPTTAFAERKAANALRGQLQGLLGIGRAYDLDRLDLVADSSVSRPVQQAASKMLRSLADPAAAQAAGMYGFRLLSPGDDLSKILFSFTLYERVGGTNELRAQTDNLDQPFDINEGARLDLGSTAKLRTLVTYLEQVADLHEKWGALDAQALAAIPIVGTDPIATWAREYLLHASDRGLRPMLDAAMDRRYSASPGETFFTGGGEHRFVNFEASEDSRTMDLHEAFTNSVNLVFIRLMRDVVRHIVASRPDSAAELLANPEDPKRRAYLERFADREGSQFVARFFRKYQGKTPQEAEDLLLESVAPVPSRLASAFFGIAPDAGDAALAGFLERRLPGNTLVPAELRAKYGPGRWSLNDRGYLAGVHPLELWLVGWMAQHPKARLAEALAASREQRQEVYGWLFKTRHKGAQDQRIRGLLELEAFMDIQRDWKRLGYPFESLTPSYASALGASGDRPAALAELMGIIVADGMKLPTERLHELQFAKATPWETRLDWHAPPPERVLPAEVAQVARAALIGVVQGGTAIRLKDALRMPDGSVVPIGGKTGTGDHRFDVFGRGLKLISSRVVDRSATLVFLIGDRWFGTIVAYAHEPYAANYKFTSALPAQLLKALLPALQPIVEGRACKEARAGASSP